MTDSSWFFFETGDLPVRASNENTFLLPPDAISCLLSGHKNDRMQRSPVVGAAIR